jgi:hypothetical protein
MDLPESSRVAVRSHSPLPHVVRNSAHPCRFRRYQPLARADKARHWRTIRTTRLNVANYNTTLSSDRFRNRYRQFEFTLLRQRVTANRYPVVAARRVGRPPTVRHAFAIQAATLEHTQSRCRSAHAAVELSSSAYFQGLNTASLSIHNWAYVMPRPSSKSSRGGA